MLLCVESRSVVQPAALMQQQQRLYRGRCHCTDLLHRCAPALTSTSVDGSCCRAVGRWTDDRSRRIGAKPLSARGCAASWRAHATASCYRLVLCVWHAVCVSGMRLCPRNVAQPSRFWLTSLAACRSQVERNNGRAAMMGITGMIAHNIAGVDSLYPIVQ